MVIKETVTSVYALEQKIRHNHVSENGLVLVWERETGCQRITWPLKFTHDYT